MWVRSIEDYAKALKIVNPKREKANAAKKRLADMQQEIADLEAEFAILTARLADL